MLAKFFAYVLPFYGTTQSYVPIKLQLKLGDESDNVAMLNLYEPEDMFRILQ